MEKKDYSDYYDRKLKKELDFYDFFKILGAISGVASIGLLIIEFLNR